MIDDLLCVRRTVVSGVCTTQTMKCETNFILAEINTHARSIQNGSNAPDPTDMSNAK